VRRPRAARSITLTAPDLPATVTVALWGGVTGVGPVAPVARHTGTDPARE
jgi:hypothetical protein